MSKAKYSESGVDLRRADSVKYQITQLISETYTDAVISKGGEFAGTIKLDDSGTGIVVSVDGVGTKLRVAFMTGQHDTVGHDLVNHCVNDIAVVGADPLCFVDYLSVGDLDSEVVLALVRGLVAGCKENEVALVGGETAQMPGFYAAGEYDIAGAIVGRLDIASMLPRPTIGEGDCLVGLASNGLHTNGYSLARRIVFELNDWKPTSYLDELSSDSASELLKVHKSYLQDIRRWRSRDGVRGFAHITGGGIPGNLSRIIPDNLTARVNPRSIPKQPVFSVLMESGNVDPIEMYQVFNMGVGLIIVCDDSTAESIVESYDDSGEAWILGRVMSRESDSPAVLLESFT